MEIRTGNYNDVIRVEKFKDVWQLTLCNEYGGEVKPQWCTLKRGDKEIIVPVSIRLSATDEGAVEILKQAIDFIGATNATPQGGQEPLPGHGAPRYGRRL